MSCNRIEELLPGFLDGDLGPGERAMVEDHLRTCPACASLLALLGETDAALASFPEVEVGDDLRERLGGGAG
ncbi:MAG: hypothetical protein GYA74_00955, partial [Acidobacteria bacterium]|nr:hypothetical protein [Acidobacteriota bacterium]